MIYNYEMETMPRERRREMQCKRLRHTVEAVYKNVPLYARRMDEAGIAPSDIKTLEDIGKLPFTLKQDLRDSYPMGMLAIPRRDVVRIHASSGTTGKRTVVAYSANDLGIWAENMARTLAGAGATSNDTVQVAYGYGLFTGGMGANNGAERLGAVTVPASVGNTRLQVELICDLGVDILCCTPSYALYLADTMEELKIDTSKLSLRAGCFGAEPWTENMRHNIESRLNIKAYDIYGLSEIMGPGVAFECAHQDGLHINEDHFYPEIVDPETGAPLPDGEYGELVFSCITREAMPLIRYRTRDIAAITHEACACGRTTVRMSKPRGRTDDMLIIRGINVFPSQIESALLEFSGIAPFYQLVVDRQGALDTIEVLVEMGEGIFSDSVRHIESMQQRMEHMLADTLGVSAAVRLVAPKTLQRSEGKSVKVVDKRKLD